MHSRKICVSLGQPTMPQALEASLRIFGADVIEVRLDYIDVPEIDPFVESLATDLLFTCRPTWEGGLFAGTEEDRLALLAEAVRAGAAYIDLELRSAEESHQYLRTYLAERETELILSYHDFESTATLAKLTGIIDQMQDAGADIGKLITTANSAADVVRVFQVLEYAAKKGLPLIAFCMGEAGAVSRVASCDLGGYMTYCCADGAEVTAAGQITISEMRGIFARYP
ncbi:type I 3-dehydroquinate dehydratase [Desulfotalea psychrophila]|uniref:3-dehydroquinate dehydratase n=1 Tax=Desulfotalea psychrophila (strain LSv54 / DSM 12343) TaxID=177439 RepID=AROD_DESPS|nr:type I 3-dehydroquinate dehydratase [Desulfotalea psychrophila]Q6AIT8.1 RecName: Full=3-dehydroquinate dehydratase; Short=3-dehydroquinase; AltName: Full=Type I DHQase; AltName: Full=Type I dehydroquinase; Short=DHQ1 [Desulfotalea psychrophila LSv54]CAG37742.1 related to 3-dehydroquinate dehydratase [Desulfotalea psychrophila LSv54]